MLSNYIAQLVAGVHVCLYTCWEVFARIGSLPSRLSIGELWPIERGRPLGCVPPTRLVRHSFDVPVPGVSWQVCLTHCSFTPA